MAAIKILFCKSDKIACILLDDSAAIDDSIASIRFFIMAFVPHFYLNIWMVVFPWQSLRITDGGANELDICDIR